MYRKTVSALVGLSGAVINNGKTESTDELVRNALANIYDTDSSQQIRQEKYRISPNCETCPSPCGNTSDYPIDNFQAWTKELRELKEQIIHELQLIATTVKPQLPEIVYRAIAYIGYDLEADAYRRLLEDIRIDKKNHSY